MNMTTFATSGFARAYAAPLCGQFRVLPEDFIVDEQLHTCSSMTQFYDQVDAHLQMGIFLSIYKWVYSCSSTGMLVEERA